MKASPFAEMVRHVLLQALQRLGATRPYRGTPERGHRHNRSPMPGRLSWKRLEPRRPI